jgi:hypothetical protein
VVASLVYSLLRVTLDLFVTSHGDQARLQAEVLAFRQLQVLERQFTRVRWTSGDRVLLAAGTLGPFGTSQDPARQGSGQ